MDEEKEVSGERLGSRWALDGMAWENLIEQVGMGLKQGLAACLPLLLVCTAYV